MGKELHGNYPPPPPDSREWGPEFADCVSTETAIKYSMPGMKAKCFVRGKLGIPSSVMGENIFKV